MANGWPSERRALQAELIKSWRPWDQSTGPRTAAGKSTVAANRAKSRGESSVRATLRELRLLLREQREALRRLEIGDAS